MDELVRADYTARPRPLAATLSPREKQLLLLATRGLTDQGIAKELKLSLATVGTYWGRVRIKFGPLSRTEIVAIYLREEASASIEELEESNSQLLVQLEGIFQTANMLVTGLEMFRTLIETAPDAILVVDEAGTIRVANELAKSMFGYTGLEMIGMAAEDLIPERFLEKHIVHRGDHAKSPERRKTDQHLALVARKKSGAKFCMAASLSTTKTPSGVLVTFIIRDLSNSEGKPHKLSANDKHRVSLRDDPKKSHATDHRPGKRPHAVSADDK